MNQAKLDPGHPDNCKTKNHVWSSVPDVPGSYYVYCLRCELGGAVDIDGPREPYNPCEDFHMVGDYLVGPR